MSSLKASLRIRHGGTTGMNLPQREKTTMIDLCLDLLSKLHTVNTIENMTRRPN